jgi:hypothetical protein
MKHTQRIQRYLDGKLEGEELRKFREDLAKDPELLKELDLYRLIDSTLQDDNVDRFRERLKEAQTSGEESENTSLLPGKVIRRKSRKMVFVVVPVAAAIISCILIFTYGVKKSAPELFTRYYHPFENVTVSRNSSDSLLIVFTHVVELYEAGDFEKACQEIPADYLYTDLSLQFSFYRGLSMLGAGRYHEATIEFEDILGSDFGYFHEHSHWYSAMCYLELNDISKACEHLLELKFSESVYSSTAAKIIRNIR